MPSILLSLQVLAVEDDFDQLVWNRYTPCGILYTISSDKVSEKCSSAAYITRVLQILKLHKCKNGLNLYLNYGIKFAFNSNEVSIDPVKFVREP